jgi:hypothetical protein
MLHVKVPDTCAQWLLLVVEYVRQASQCSQGRLAGMVVAGQHEPSGGWWWTLIAQHILHWTVLTFVDGAGAPGTVIACHALPCCRVASRPAAGESSLWRCTWLWSWRGWRR